MNQQNPSRVLIADTLPEEAGLAVLKSLPFSFSAAPDAEAADVWVLDGQQPDWPQRVAAAAGRQVILVDPVPAGQPAGLSFWLDTPWGSNPVCDAVATELATHPWELAATAWQRLECRALVPTTASPEQALLNLVSLARAVGVAIDALRVQLHDELGVTAVGRSGDHEVDFDVTLTDAVPPRARLRALTSDGDITATIPGPRTALPAALVVTDVGGSVTSPTLWESSHRATWRRLLRAEPAHDARAFAEDAATVTSALNQKEELS
ncbi:MAG: hypothetical protein QM804_14160 [Propionicimonas sp.]